MTAIDIRTDDLRGPEIAALLTRHLDHMFAVTPAGSVYALDLDALRVPAITFWSAWIDGGLVGCIALKDLGGGHGEIKSAHTVEQMRGRGIGRALVAHLIDQARARGMTRLSLETGQTDHFRPAQELYRRFGFVECGPFGDYGPDPHSYFMTRTLD
ncbi:GNAT family N-acetyltransferase [Roseitalea porphyridii]|uniref:GNAT family N-acetyltransferase n=1 Tax=Roseitalea porphyridii TaxID=1852022 RepID=A0A4P6UYW4_9HYPH|nr:GNAT family N-acetyltransferase [Roseitalea porphyridii]QBK29683.1 GNAT family N-acetyltransferase [Roseitalea porphyridii]